MDKSEQYKKMSYAAERAAPELFYKAVFDVHDYTFKVDGNDLLWWLPRQDDLQKMMLNETKLESWRLLWVFASWLEEEHPETEDFSGEITYKWEHSPLLSMEKLWLAFVMKEKCGKVWDGEKWVK